MCKWLGWVPPKANEISTFAHCQVRVPDELKYSLHQLFFRHGRECVRCRASTGQGAKGWAEGCVIDHLVTRTGARKELGGPLPHPVKVETKEIPSLDAVSDEAKEEVKIDVTITVDSQEQPRTNLRSRNGTRRVSYKS
jgi:DNA-(apurinic or apyrimidinic site) lyase